MLLPIYLCLYYVIWYRVRACSVLLFTGNLDVTTPIPSWRRLRGGKARIFRTIKTAPLALFLEEKIPRWDLYTSCPISPTPQQKDWPITIAWEWTRNHPCLYRGAVLNSFLDLSSHLRMLFRPANVPGAKVCRPSVEHFLREWTLPHLRHTYSSPHQHRRVRFCGISGIIAQCDIQYPVTPTFNKVIIDFGIGIQGRMLRVDVVSADTVCFGVKDMRPYTLDGVYQLDSNEVNHVFVAWDLVCWDDIPDETVLKLKEKLEGFRKMWKDSDGPGIGEGMDIAEAFNTIDVSMMV